MLLDAPAWTVKKTFVEVVSEDQSGYGMSRIKRSSSDSKLSDLSLTADPSSWSSSTNNYDGNDGNNNDQSLSNSWASHYAINMGLRETLNLHKKIWDLCAESDGKDIRDVISTDFEDVDIKQYVPRDLDSDEYLSLGSVLHLVGSCQPCHFISKGRCHKAETCLYCHAKHAAPMRRPRKSKKQRTNMARARDISKNEGRRKVVKQADVHSKDEEVPVEFDSLRSTGGA